MELVDNIRHCSNCSKGVPANFIEIHQYNCCRRTRSFIKAQSSLSRIMMDQDEMIPCECGDDFPWIHYGEHLQKCPLRSAQLCQFCQDFYPDYLMEEHHFVCPRKLELQRQKRMQRMRQSLRQRQHQLQHSSQNLRMPYRPTEMQELTRRDSRLRMPSRLRETQEFTSRNSTITNDYQRRPRPRPNRSQRIQLESEGTPPNAVESVQAGLRMLMLQALADRTRIRHPLGSNISANEEQVGQRGNLQNEGLDLGTLINNHSAISHNLLTLVLLLRQLGAHDKGLKEEDIAKLHLSKSKEGDGNCTVCYCELQQGEEIYTLRCKHVFHVECLKPWLRKNSQCPNCRKEVKEEEQEEEIEKMEKHEEDE